MNKIRIGIIGGAGYTAGELLRILIHHPLAEIVFVHSKSNSGKKIYEVHDDLFGDTDLVFSNHFHNQVDVVFLCMAHGESKEMVKQFDNSIKIIDLSQDFRLLSDGNPFVYGLPELNKEAIKKAQHIANPGCFATAIQLALLPLAEKNLLQSDVHITCTTGSTGAGQSLSETSHFSWRQNNLSVYKAFTHQHLAEIGQSLVYAQPSFHQSINMIPQRGAFTRGIMASMYLTCENTLEEIVNIFEAKYENHPFVFVSKKNIHLKQVVNTNKCLLYLEKQDNKLLIVSIIDNLLKGASGQAVQNMNLLFGLEETMGLQLKPSAF
jgi:N-acetyl-gamma-glutamyl-phosphate reductase